MEIEENGERVSAVHVTAKIADDFTVREATTKAQWTSGEVVSMTTEIANDLENAITDASARRDSGERIEKSAEEVGIARGASTGTTTAMNIALEDRGSMMIVESADLGLNDRGTIAAGATMMTAAIDVEVDAALEVAMMIAWT